MAFTYYPPEEKASDNWAAHLRHNYFVQVSPDGRHLVPGILQAGERPEEGGWLNVKNIARDFPVRYFVQYTDFNTLVPGSLIQQQQRPEGRWREIKKKAPLVYRFMSDVHWYGADFDEYPNWGMLNDVDQFNYYLNSQILPVIYPDHDPEDALTFKLFYFHGSLEDFDGDISKLVSFDAPGGFIKLGEYEDRTVLPGTILSTNTLTSTIFMISNEAPVGSYLVGIAIMNAQDKIDTYVLLADLIRR